MLVTKVTSKVQAAILVAVVVVASVSAYYFIHDQWLITNQMDATMPKSSATIQTLAATVLAAPLVSNDSNWAGYIVASDLQNPQSSVTSVSASWAIPTVTPSPKDAFSAIWIGVGGYFDKSLLQVGSEQDCTGGQVVYFVWYELLPATSITLDTITVNPGDQINASLTLVDPSTDEWSIFIADQTSNQAYQNNVTYASSQLSAEWIVERPSTGRHILTLANIESVTFTDCQATIGAQTGVISDFPTIQSVMYHGVLDEVGINQLAATSDLKSGGSSFTVDTSTAVIPELPIWVILPAFVCTVLFAAAEKKRSVKKKRNLSSFSLPLCQRVEKLQAHQKTQISWHVVLSFGR
jgi:hypothetical protein